jgi:hypothetical protein
MNSKEALSKTNLSTVIVRLSFSSQSFGINKQVLIHYTDDAQLRGADSAASCSKEETKIHIDA